MSSRLHIDKANPNNDIIYLNAYFVNDSQTLPGLVNFEQTRRTTIIQNPEEYYLAIVRFDIPNNSLPIFIFRENIYSVTITNGGVDYQVYLEYDSYGNSQNLIPGFNYNGIFYFSQFLQMLNAALLEAHALSGSTGEPPIMILRSDGRFEMRIDQAYSGDIYFSWELYNLFYGIPAFFLSYSDPNGKDYEMVSFAYGYNSVTVPTIPGVTFNLMVQENKSQYLWPEIKSLVITTDNIPCRREYIGLNVNANSQETAAITDFIPVASESSGIDRTDWVYQAITPRLVQIMSTNPLKSIDFKVYLVNKSGDFIPLHVGPGESVSVKFMFAKKSLYNNDITSQYSSTDRDMGHRTYATGKFSKY